MAPFRLFPSAPMQTYRNNPSASAPNGMSSQSNSAGQTPGSGSQPQRGASGSTGGYFMQGQGQQGQRSGSGAVGGGMSQSQSQGVGTIGGGGGGYSAGTPGRRVAESSDFPALSPSQSMHPPQPLGSNSYATQAQSSTMPQPPPHLAHLQSQQQQQQHQQIPPPPPGLQNAAGNVGAGAHLQNGINGQINGMNVNGSVGDGLRNEDFPALGGQDKDGRMLLGQSSKSGGSTTAVSPSPPPSSLMGHPPPRSVSQASYPSYLEGASVVGSDYRQGGATPAASQGQGQMTEPLTKPAQQLASSPVDKWGLAALLRLLRTGGSNDLLALSLGEDLANIGLDMNGTNPLYPTFIQPWAEPETLQNVYLEEEFRIPQCYNVNTPRASTKMNVFSDETLFYAFYSCPRDLLQMEVAAELFARQWRFHKELGMWLTKDSSSESEKGVGFERGSYIVFNPNTFTREGTEPNFLLKYDAIETEIMQQPAGNGVAGEQAGAPGQQQQQGQGQAPGQGQGQDQPQSAGQQIAAGGR